MRAFDIVRKSAVLPCLFVLLLSAAQGYAATVRQVFGKASAPENTKLSDGQSFSTGAKSKAHVALNKGFFRVGSEAQVQVVTSNNLSLEKGIMLAGSDPARFSRPAVNVSAPGYKLEVRGTVQIAYYPGAFMKITVLEGKVRVALQSLSGEWETIGSGQMLIIIPSDKRLPEPVVVDISRLASTSKLIGGAFGELSTQGLIDAAAAGQGAGYLAGDLTQTPFRLSGASPETSYALPNRETAANGNANALRPDELSVFRLVNDVDNPKALVPALSYSEGNGTVSNFSTFPVSGAADPFQLARSATSARSTKWTVNMSSETDGFGQYVGPPTLHGTITASADMFGGSGKMLTFYSFEPGLTDDEAINGTTDYALHVMPGTSIKTPPHVGLNLTGRVGLVVEDAQLTAGNATATDEPLELVSQVRNLSVTGSDLKGGSIVLAGSNELANEAQQQITVDDSRLSARNDINVGTKTKRTLIALQNTTQLSALVGSITIQSKGGPVTVDTSGLEALHGTITIDSLDTNDPSAVGTVTLRNATLAADVIRARGYSPSGDALIIDGGTFNAASLIKLYAEGASTLRFVNDTTLNTPLAILAGQTVEVNGGKTVNISGQGRVFTDNAHYNTGAYGTITAGGGLIAQPYAARPRF